MSKCHCGSQQEFSACCGRYLFDSQSEPAAWPDSPEALMRSRYSAFVEKNIHYIRETTDPQAMSDFDEAATLEWMNGATFMGLEILRGTNEGNKGIVEFKAHYKMGEDAPLIHHEISKFRKSQGRWYFRDARVLAPS